MKKRSWMALALVLTMLAACLTVLVLNTGAVEEGYFVYVEESRQLTALEGATADKQALVLDGATVSADEAGRGGKTLFFNGYVITNNRVRSYKVFFNGQEQPAAVAYSFNVLASASKGGGQYQGEETLKSATYNVTVKIPEGKYDSVVIKAVDSEKAEFEVIRPKSCTKTIRSMRSPASFWIPRHLHRQADSMHWRLRIMNTMRPSPHRRRAILTVITSVPQPRWDGSCCSSTATIPRSRAHSSTLRRLRALPATRT